MRGGAASRGGGGGGVPTVHELPLSGRCVVVTRAEAAGGPLGARLTAHGAFVCHWPVVRILPPADPGPLEKALASLGRYDWIVFSSPRAVYAVAGGVDRFPDGLRVAAVGDSTAESLRGAKWPVDVTPKQFGGEGLVAAFAEHDLAHGTRILFPAGSIARSTIPDGLTALGAQVDRVVAYETTPSSLDKRVCVEDIESGRVDAVTFASPSAVVGLQRVLGTDTFGRMLERSLTVAIGPTTAEALEQMGVSPTAVAHSSTLDGLVDAVVTVFNEGSN